MEQFRVELDDFFLDQDEQIVVGDGEIGAEEAANLGQHGGIALLLGILRFELRGRLRRPRFELGAVFS